MGKNNRDYMDEQEAKKVFQVFDNVYTTRIPAKGFGYEIIRKDGGKRYIEVSVALIEDAKRQPAGFRCIGRDATEKRRLETQLHQSQKMEAIGTLAGGVAHDFNNLLTIIMGNADLALSGIGKDSPVIDDIKEIRTAGERAAALTGQLLAFSRKQTIQPRTMDINESVGGIEKMLRRLIGENIELSMILEPGLWKIHADPGQVDQVIMNLAVNARDAMPQGGTLTIETANADLSADDFRDHGLEDHSGSYVMLAVSDTGIGMDQETQDRIFEPFFTTKDRDKGTGLGLSTVYGIVKQNSGFVWAYSELERGTTFKIYIPSMEGNGEPEDEKASPIGELKGSETILVVEDDDSVRKIAVKALRSFGYNVLESQDGEEALRCGEDYSDPIHVLITDVVMPGMNGRDLAESFLSLRPKVRVIYMSGYTDNAIAHHGVIDPDVNFLEKPFSPESLTRKVRDVLDQRQ